MRLRPKALRTVERARALTLGAALTFLASPAASAAQSRLTRDKRLELQEAFASVYDGIARRYQLTSLSEATADSIEFELRVFGANGRDFSSGFVLRTEHGTLRAYRLQSLLVDTLYRNERTALRGDWKGRWKQLDSIGLLLLPPLGDDPTYGAGMTTVLIELRTGPEYRRWTYSPVAFDTRGGNRDSSLDGRMKRIVLLVRGWLDAEPE